MAIEGPLRELGLSDLFQMLDLARKTGVLTVRNESRPHPAVVRFDHGAIVGTELPGTPGRLGQLLLRAGKITQRQMEDALREQQTDPHRPYGTIMVEKEWVSKEDVQRQLRFQVEETIFELIRWREGYFRFEDMPGSDLGMVGIRLTIQQLLMEAARRIDEWTVLETAIPHMDVVPGLIGGEMSGAESATLDLRPDEWEVLGEIDGEHTLREISQNLASSDLAVAKIAFGLVSAGVVEIIGERIVAPPAAPDTGLPAARMAEVEAILQAREFRHAQRRVAELLRDHPDSAEAYLLAGRISSEMGRWRDACDALIRATQQDPLSASAHYHLGFAAVRVGDLSRAEEAWTTYLRLPDAETHRRDVATRAAGAAADLRRILDEEGE